MAGRRHNGEGHIYQRKDGRWHGIVSGGKDPATGKIKRINLYAKTKEELLEKMTALKTDQYAGLPMLNTDITVGEWLDIWLEQYKKPTVKDATYTGTYYYAVVALKAKLGAMKLAELKPTHIQVAINSMTKSVKSDASGKKKQVSTSVMSKARMTLSQACELAIANGLIRTNPTKTVVIPRSKKREKAAFTIEEQEKIMAYCNKPAITKIEIKGQHNKDMTMFLLQTGLRIGEAMALVWDDVDFDKKLLRVDETRTVLYDAESKKTYVVIDTPKTESSIRTLPITDTALDILKRRKELNQSSVFTNSQNNPMTLRNYDRALELICKAAGVNDLSPHELRHTVTSRLAEADIHPRVIADILGHADITEATRVYVHVHQNKLKDSMAVLDRKKV